MRCALLLVVAALLGCMREEAVRPRFATVHRFVEHPPADLGAPLRWGHYVAVGGEERLTLTSLTHARSAIVEGTPPDPAGTTTAWSLRIPDALQDADWLFVRPRALGSGGGAWLPARMVAPRETGPVLAIDLEARAADPAASLVAEVAPIPPLATRTIETAPVAVPAGGVLTLGMGVREPGQAEGAAAVAFEVVALDGADAIPLHAAVLDPVRVARHRTWLDARIDLAPVAGRTVRFRLTTRAAATGDAGTSLPLWADPVVLAPAAAPPVNVVLVSLDTLRAQSVSAYGAARETTPHLDRTMREEGTIFDLAYTTAPHTLPSHVSVFSGLWVQTHGVTAFTRKLPPDVPVLAEQLRAAGYLTAAFTENGFVVPGVGIRRGFGTYRENTSPDLHAPLGQSAKTFRAGLDWLATHRDAATFLFLHTYEVHHPYAPPPPYDAAFEPVLGAPDDPAVELLRYEQEARYLDDELRAFLDGLDGLGLGPRTLLVIFSDHGEEFREHGRLRHLVNIYEETARVPLMMRLPGVVPAGRRERTPVSLVDVGPTILDVVGAPPLTGADGTSLAPLFRDAPLPAWRTAVFTESSAPDGVVRLGVRLARVHCIFLSTGTSECFDPEVDPFEEHPITARDARPLLARAAAVAHRAVRPAVPLGAAPAPTPADTADFEARVDKLRALGYLE